MEVPENFSLKVYMTLIQLYADQMGVTIKYKIENGGEWLEVDTSKVLLDRSEP